MLRQLVKDLDPSDRFYNAKLLLLVRLMDLTGDKIEVYQIPNYISDWAKDCGLNVTPADELFSWCSIKQ